MKPAGLPTDGTNGTSPLSGDVDFSDELSGEHLEHRGLVQQVPQLIRAIDDGDDKSVEEAVLQLSHSRRYLAPLALVVGAFVMLFQGLKLVVCEWRLTLVQILPAMWIWAAMLDLRLHVLHGREFRLWHGALAILAVAIVALVSVAAFYLNCAFAFALTGGGKPDVRSAFILARHHLGVVAPFGIGVGAALGYSAVFVPRWGLGWFALSMSIVIAVMMLTYVNLPSHLVGLKSSFSGRDKLAATAVAGAVGAVVCVPAYVTGRVGVLLLGSPVVVVFVVGIVLLSLGLTLQAGATGAVKAIKMSAKLVAGTLPASESTLDHGTPDCVEPSATGNPDTERCPGA
jgi:hypothetical protein